MSIALVTGSAGLIGAESVQFFAGRGFDVAGIDNDMRRVFFGDSASTAWRRRELEAIPGYRHHKTDIRDVEGLGRVFAQYGSDIKVVIHTAAQPSHDWGGRDPLTDFAVNATGTLNLLEATRRHCPDAVFIFTSTNKVYGDTPNRLPLVELETRWELPPDHPYYAHGIDEGMGLDRSAHSIMGASKVAADIMTQEYGRYFGMKTVCFRGGCLTGPNHSGATLHGFLAYLAQCAITGAKYTVFGYKGKQVRDNIHAHDLTRMFWTYFQDPTPGEVYNAGGGRHSNCSVIEAIALVEEITGRKMNYEISEDNRRADHIWWISDVRKFRERYPDWDYEYDLRRIVEEICEGVERRSGRKRAR